MKKHVFKITLIVVLFAASMLVLAESMTTGNSSTGNAKMMSRNLNEPNAINPATHNMQNYEHNNSGRIESKHTEDDLANKYNNTLFTGSGEKKETETAR